MDNIFDRLKLLDRRALVVVIVLGGLRRAVVAQTPELQFSAPVVTSGGSQGDEARTLK